MIMQSKAINTAYNTNRNRGITVSQLCDIANHVTYDNTGSTRFYDFYAGVALAQRAQPGEFIYEVEAGGANLYFLGDEPAIISKMNLLKSKNSQM